MKTFIFYLCMYKDTASSKEISLTVNDKTDKTNTKQKKLKLPLCVGSALCHCLLNMAYCYRFYSVRQICTLSECLFMTDFLQK